MSDGFPIVRFVTSPDVDAEVLYECNVSTDTKYVGHSGFDAGTPTWSAEPGTIGGIEGYRTLSFTHYVSADPGIAAVALRDLAQIVLADSAWLMVQLTVEAAPVWFRTWRSTPGSLSLEDIFIVDGGIASGRYGIPVSLTADAYAVGELRTLATGTINNDPAAATNRNVLLLGTPEGDAPAPAVITVDKWQTNNQANLIQVSTVPASYTAPYLVQIGTGDSLYNISANFAIIASAAASNGSYRNATLADTLGWIDGTTSTAAGAFTTALPSLPAGDYLVYIRLAISTPGTRVEVATYVGHASSAQTLLTASLPAESGSAQWHWQLMGMVQFPLGVTVPDEMRVGSSTITDGVLTFVARRVAGSNGIDVDAIVLIPASTKSAALTIGHAADTSGPEVVDGEIEAVYKLTAGAYKPSNLEVSGGFPYLYPGLPHALHRFENTLGSAVDAFAGDRKAAAEDVTVAYRPRYLWVQP